MKELIDSSIRLRILRTEAGSVFENQVDDVGFVSFIPFTSLRNYTNCCGFGGARPKLTGAEITSNTRRSNNLD
jgi:hypothetical protein